MPLECGLLLHNALTSIEPITALWEADLVFYIQLRILAVYGCMLAVFGRKVYIILSTYADIFSVKHPMPDVIGRNGGKILCSKAMTIAV